VNERLEERKFDMTNEELFLLLFGAAAAASSHNGLEQTDK
jgi:hypothetical protein